MNNEQRNTVIEALAEFVVRASKEDATPEEITALPEVAKVLLSTWFDV